MMSGTQTMMERLRAEGGRVVGHSSIQRDLLLNTIRAGPVTWAGIITIATILDRKIVEMSQTALFLEICDSPEKAKELMVTSEFTA